MEITKGKVALIELPSNQLYKYKGKIVGRTSGLVRIVDVQVNEVTYVFLTDPEILISSTMRRGFYRIVVFPQTTNEDHYCMEVSQKDAEYAGNFLPKTPNFPIYLVSPEKYRHGKETRIWIKDTGEQPVAYLRRSSVLPDTTS